jgi:molybdenum cofactor biosynthesis enzyme MoaA
MCYPERPQIDARPREKSRGSVPSPALPKFNNVPPHLASAEDQRDLIPGRGDLRISLTSRCDLKCAYCHNEGQKVPWLQQTKPVVTIDEIKELLDIATRYRVRSVKFSGGDPGVYPGLFKLLDTIAAWRSSYPSIVKWGICTSGRPFLLNPKKFQALVASDLDNISIGIDSVEPGEFSKSSSPFGILGQDLIDKFVTPLVKEWKGRAIKFDTVFTGDKGRTLNVIRAARTLKVNVSVIEVNGVMGTGYDDSVRRQFLEVVGETAEEYGLRPRLHEQLNEIYLYDEQNNTPIKFYQDHCRDLDCGNCRKIHLRVSPTSEGWGAVPCFLQAQSKTVPLMISGKLSDARFEDAIRHNGRGPRWFKDTPYESSELAT